MGTEDSNVISFDLAGLSARWSSMAVPRPARPRTFEQDVLFLVEIGVSKDNIVAGMHDAFGHHSYAGKPDMRWRYAMLRAAVRADLEARTQGFRAPGVRAPWRESRVAVVQRFLRGGITLAFTAAFMALCTVQWFG